MKNSIHFIFRSMAISVLLLISAHSAMAQSTVYFFMRSMTSTNEATCNIVQDDDISFSMLGAVKKQYKHMDWYPENVKSYQYKPAVRKCVYNEEGQKDFEFTFKHVYYVPQKGRQVNNMHAGISLNLTSGSIHYVYISAKGMGIEMEEVHEQKAQQLFKDKDLDTLPDLVDGEPAEAAKQ